MILEILILGFFLGMTHALEPDHIAAVGAITLQNQTSWKKLLYNGVFWGSGHSIMLLIICGGVIALDFAMTDFMAAWLETGVGVMLLILGFNVFYRIRQQSLHLHIHDHSNGSQHMHFHVHPSRKNKPSKVEPHKQQAHQHSHPSLRMLLVGLMHGAAGSASLLAIAVAVAHSALEAMIYVAVFGLGSILGMGLLTVAVAWPIGLIERRWINATRVLSICSGLVAFALGLNIIFNNMVVFGVLAK